MTTPTYKPSSTTKLWAPCHPDAWSSEMTASLAKEIDCYITPDGLAIPVPGEGSSSGWTGYAQKIGVTFFRTEDEARTAVLKRLEEEIERYERWLKSAKGHRETVVRVMKER